MHACADRQPIKTRGREHAAFPTLVRYIRPLRVGISVDRLTNKYFVSGRSFFKKQIFPLQEEKLDRFI